MSSATKEARVSETMRAPEELMVAVRDLLADLLLKSDRSRLVEFHCPACEGQTAERRGSNHSPDCRLEYLRDRMVDLVNEQMDEDL